jgi:hypothetical protein
VPEPTALRLLVVGVAAMLRTRRATSRPLD